ncbi:MAG TPA: zf-HC2 domain-containing protein [Longimicrobiales bacterium]|nr:zf-HC2 domain-containing protein [Longimicrobiales bacterium]
MTGFNRFSCEEAFRRLGDYLDRELSASEMALIDEHLEICAGCAREFAFERSILNGVRTKLREVELPADLRARIATLLEESATGRSDE